LVADAVKAGIGAKATGTPLGLPTTKTLPTASRRRDRYPSRSGAVSFHEHLRAERDRQHERDGRGRRSEFCSNGSGDTDQRNAGEKKTAPSGSDRRPRSAFPKLAASHEELDCSTTDHAESDGREPAQDEQHGRGDVDRKVL